jgi:Flp pilus assembly protein TadD
MTRTAFKAAASTLIVSMAMTGFSGQSDAMRRLGDPERATSRADREAEQFHASGARSLREGHNAEAQAAMEQAVALSPRDAGYRQLLADIYLRAGRFDSARTTYGDVLELDPANIRAALSIALIQIAQGNGRAAVARLDDIAGRAPAADVGLAFALAGETGRAVQILEEAARAPGATARTRQNLALAYAMSGDWRRARAVAAQDLSPADVPERMQQWAALARPGGAPAQVAALLGVSPAQDPGQPVRLALAPVASERAFAEAAPAEIPAAPIPAYAPVPAPAAQAPVQVAEAAPAEAPAFWVPTAQSYQAPAEAPVESGEVSSEPAAPPPEVRIQYASAARTLVAPEPALIRAAGITRVPVPIFQRARPRVAIANGNAPVVVQLGAFSNEGNAERAWLQASSRYHLESRRPLATTIDIDGRTLHRVSVSGFASAGDAQRLCGQIRVQGGACFVRGQAGDASIRWAARYANPRQRNV